MSDAVLRIGEISIYSFGLLAVLSYLWGAFVFYKKGVHAHFEEIRLLDGIVVAAFWAVIVGRLVFALTNPGTFWNHFSRVLLISNFPGVSVWGVLLGLLLGFYTVTRKIKTKLIDWLDLVSLGVLAGGAIFYAGLAWLANSWQYVVLGVSCLGLFILFWGVEETYRTFGWYRNHKTSAKSGLITGFSLSASGLMVVVGDLTYRKINMIDGLISIILLVGGLVLVYIRSGRTVAEDIKIIFKNGRK